MELYRIKTPYTCVVCKTHLIEKFEVAFPVVHNTGRRIYGGVTPQLLRQRRAERLASWYPKSLGIMCPKCDIKYEKKSMGYTIEQVKERMNFISFVVTEKEIIPLEAFKNPLKMKMEDRLDALLRKESKKKNPSPLLSHFKLAKKPKGKKLNVDLSPRKFTGTLWLKNPMFGSFGDSFFFPLTYQVPNGMTIVALSMGDTVEGYYVISVNVFKKLKPEEEKLPVEIAQQKKKTKKAA